MQGKNPDAKRRLELMPEVLPAPTPSGRGPVRERTLGHMRRLLAAAAAVSAAACSRESGQSAVSVTIPASTASGMSTGPAGTRSVAVNHPTVPSATAAPTATAPDIGYGVVDPMPAPARCAGVAAASKATAVFHTDATGLYLEVTISLGRSLGTKFDRSSPPSSWGSNLLGAKFNGGSVVLRLRPSSMSSAALGVSTSVACAAGPGTLSAQVQWTGAPKDGTRAAVTLSDY